MNARTSDRVRFGLCAVALALATSSIWAAPPEGQRGGRADDAPRQHEPHPGVRPPAGQRPHAGQNQWFDGAHGHAHAYPVPGWSVRALPPRHSTVIWGGVNYGFFDGVWYSPGPRGYVVVRPPYGIVVGDLPLFRSVVVIGGLSYLYANGVYYRERVEGGYEVVPPPVAADTTAANAAGRTFVYPKMGQSAQQQASDEYECHRWAVTQSGFDPTAVATGTTVATPGAALGKRDDYQRARMACLEGRGYTVR